ncbi:MAG: zinc-binding dehydrogenase [Rhodospirillaceae bacterium]|jgi:alcohol dehydrogenase|nr:zinc-binding dehydrogenase [Rhodospirillaceae bacterium]MBT5455145.1 zinc-binding dehydrogenase [Rhodospirillaceae bacterium]
MKAAVIEKQGGVENIVYGDWPDPEAGPDDVVVRVRACGLNHLDIFVRRGMPGFPVPMPWISGGDIAGEIDTVGENVTGWSVGDRVTLNPGTDEGMIGEQVIGGLAELVRVPAKYLIRLPDNISFDTAAAIPINYGTAHRMLFHRGRLKEGEIMLVLGASGGVGQACVQFGKMAGAIVIAAAGSREKGERLLEMGADHVINYAEQDFSAETWKLTGKKGAHMVINFTGGDTWAPCLRAARKGGRVLTCGATAGHSPETDLRFIWVRELDVLGSNSYSQQDIERSVSLISDGQFTPVISHTLPLDRTGEAETLMEERNFFGKIIVNP